MAVKLEKHVPWSAAGSLVSHALCASLNSTVVCSTSDSEGGAIATEKAMVTQHVVVYMMHDGTGLVKCRSCHIDAL